MKVGESTASPGWSLTNITTMVTHNGRARHISNKLSDTRMCQPSWVNISLFSDPGEQVTLKRPHMPKNVLGCRFGV